MAGRAGARSGQGSGGDSGDAPRHQRRAAAERLSVPGRSAADSPSHERPPHRWALSPDVSAGSGGSALSDATASRPGPARRLPAALLSSEALWSQERYCEAAPVYLQLALSDLNGQKPSDASLAAFLSWQRCLRGDAEDLLSLSWSGNAARRGRSPNRRSY